MNYTITLSNYPIPFRNNEADRLTFKLIIKDTNFMNGATEEMRLLNFNEWEFGNDDDDETIHFPSNIDLEMLVSGDIAKLESIHWLLKIKKVTAFIYKNEDLAFVGTIDADSVEVFRSTKRIALTITDQFQKLKSPDHLPKNNPFSYTLDAAVKITDLIKDLFTRPELFDDDETYIDEVISLCKIEGQAIINGNTVNVPFENIAVDYAHFFNPLSPYETVLDVLKAILTTFGCVGIIGPDRKFYMIPRVYNNSPVFLLNKKHLSEEPEIGMTPGNKNLRVTVHSYGWTWNSVSNGWAIGETIDPWTDRNIESEDYEELICFDGGGTLPGGKTSIVILYCIFDNNAYIMLPDSYRNVFPNGTYTDAIFGRLPLWRVVYFNIFNHIYYPQRTVEISVIGNYEVLKFNQFYYFQDSPNIIYRLRKAAYELDGKHAKLSLVECSDSQLTTPTEKIIFRDIMDIPAQVEYNGQVLTEGIPYNISGRLTILFNNEFASTELTATKYDGTVINIPANQVSVHQTIDQYVVYIAIQNGAAAPASSYPTVNDNNAKWFLLATLNDNRLSDTEYIYRLQLPRINTRGKKFYLWAGFKSENAQLFAGITPYSSVAAALPIPYIIRDTK